MTGDRSAEVCKMTPICTRRRTYSGGVQEEYELDMDKAHVKAMQACKTGNLETVQTLHKFCGVNFAMADYDDRSPLHQAVEYNHIEVVKYLVLKCGVPFNIPDRWNMSPISVALELNHVDIVEFLEEQALKKDHAMLEEVAANEEAVAYKLCDAAARGNLDFLKESHRQGVNLAQVDYDGRTALHLACNEGQLEVTKFLLEVLHKDCLRIVDRFGNTPLTDAQKSGNLEIAKLLKDHCSPVVEAMASATSEAQQKVVLWEELHVAISQCDDVELRAVLQKVKSQEILLQVLTSTQDQCEQWQKEGNMNKKLAGSGALMVGSSETLIEQVCHAPKKVYTLMAAILEKEYEFGVLASDVIDALIRKRKNRVLQLFLEKTNADPNVTSEGGRCPLYTAIEVGNPDAVNILSKHGAKFNEIAQQYRYSPLFYLIRSDNLRMRSFMEMLEVLLICGADPNTCESYHGLYPVHHVLQSSYTATEIIDIITMLLQYKLNIDAEDRAGLTALHYASGDAQHRPNQKLNEDERTKIVNFLCDSGSEINRGSKDGNTALHFAVKSGYRSVVCCLLNQGADCHRKNLSNYTATDFPPEESEIWRLLNDHLHIPREQAASPSKQMQELPGQTAQMTAQLPCTPQTSTRQRPGSTNKPKIPSEHTDNCPNSKNSNTNKLPAKNTERIVNIRLVANSQSTPPPRSASATSTKPHTNAEKAKLLKAAIEYLSQRIGDNFGKFSRHLNKDIDVLRADASLQEICWSHEREGLEEVSYQVLKRWHHRVGRTASLTDLVTALDSAKMLELKKAFKERFAPDLVREVLAHFSKRKD